MRVITGACSDIGKATALRLAGMGMTVAIVARDQERGQVAQAEIKAASANSDVDLLVADLPSLAEVRWSAGEVQSCYPSLHVLINNSGVAPIKRQVTADGLERDNVAALEQVLAVQARLREQFAARLEA